MVGSSDEDYRAIADGVAADIAAGRLRVGEQLPPQRRFARDRRIATSTAARVYTELTRRGLVVGEVGRGTFVRAAAPPVDPPGGEPARAGVDLELNFPSLPGQSEMLTRSLSAALRPDAFDAASAPVPVGGTAEARRAVARLLGEVDPDQVLLAGNGRQAIGAAIAAVVPAGGRLGVEALTYPVVRGIARNRGVTLVPLELDEDGIRPDALERAAVDAVYVQPALQNPLGSTMSAERRTAFAEVVRDRGVPVIEDRVNAFLCDEPRLADHIPEYTIVVDSLSKRIAPGLTLGFVAVPPKLWGEVARALRCGGWAASGFALDAATRWIVDGTLDELVGGKRADAAWRQELMRARLGGFAIRADARAYHCWWELPEPWRADTFVAAAARHGIAVSPAASFTVDEGHAPSAVRLALAAPPESVLTGALEVLARLARGGPDDTGPS
ncbi:MULTISPECIES: aminotransferase-like domain-containing protein [Prauserella salsuginis group]|uniref:PLP-dependent aminotransferase family protein n=1 Tax=Prauserella salsuginis TaxID=387889 RepID=A0ABW6G9Q2_9PSEU|nr:MULTISPECIES: PLP-dependent aminotransferase family protein [Prauserella salsuginis group]MCR3721624.1 DNA-binding transcriptional regulator, MocR family, contains an aminotransferase domain [Prauserella flava]MCR3734316.1 DNA-binding transcriptional regulator, MocR family, contains an aminotransferase domain [Prauserella salsuginis]